MFSKRLLGSLLLVALSIVLAPGLAAQSPLDEARERADEAARRSDEAQALADVAEREVLDSVIAIESATGRLVAIESELELLGRRVTVAQAERDQLFGDVQFLAVQSYINQEDIGVGFLVGEDITEGAEREVFLEFISGISIDSIDRYRVVTQDLEIALDEQAIVLDAQKEVLGELADENMTLEVALAQADSQLVEVQAQEAVFQAEVAKLEEQERRRIEEARRKAAAERKRQADAARQEAEQERQQKAEQDRIRQEEERQNSDDQNSNDQNSIQSTTTTTPATTTTQPSVITGGGGILCPIGGATSFTDTWGAARSSGRRHEGTDMFAARGTPVVAPVAGTVRQSNSSRGGFGFWLVGDNGVTYFGSHMDTPGASGRVSAGTVVGTVGNSGNARFTATHLHFEIHPGGGGAVNPYSTVRSACG